MLNAKVGYVFFVGWENENLKVDETRIKGIKKWIQIETKKSQFLDFKDFFFSQPFTRITENQTIGLCNR